jgi:hypothetical protein
MKIGGLASIWFKPVKKIGTGHCISDVFFTEKIAARITRPVLMFFYYYGSLWQLTCKI